MTDSEKFDLVLQKLDSIDQKMNSMVQRMDSLEQRMDSLEQRMDSLEQRIDSLVQRMDSMQQQINTLERKVTDLSLHIENVTDKNIQLIAENYINLTTKLNQAIPIADKNLAYEVKVNYLLERVQILENEVKELKSRTA